MQNLKLTSNELLCFLLLNTSFCTKMKWNLQLESTDIWLKSVREQMNLNPEIYPLALKCSSFSSHFPLQGKLITSGHCCVGKIKKKKKGTFFSLHQCFMLEVNLLFSSEINEIRDNWRWRLLRKAQFSSTPRWPCGGPLRPPGVLGVGVGGASTSPSLLEADCRLSHQRDLHLLPPLHLPTRMLLRGWRSSTDLHTSVGEKINAQETFMFQLLNKLEVNTFG